ncbi:MAG: hypothetical protein ACK5LC_05930 [Coprobacillaceae bacterium]
MNEKNELKKVITKDLNKEKNYLHVLEGSGDKKNKRIAVKVIICSLVLLIGVAVFQNTPFNKTDDSYFATTIYADDEAYETDDVIEFESVIEDSEFHIDTNLDQKEDSHTVYSSQGYRVDLKIKGENIESITYKAVSDNDTVKMYRGASGELQYTAPDANDNIFNVPLDANLSVSKRAKDLTKEQVQKLLEISGYMDVDPESLNETQIHNLYYSGTVWSEIENGENQIDDFGNPYKENPVFNGFNCTPLLYEILTMSEVDSKKADETYGGYVWDLVEDSKELTMDSKTLDSEYAIFVGGTYSYEYDLYDVTTEEEYEKRYDPIKHEYKTALLNDLANTTKIEISITYKNGVVKNKELSYKLVESGTTWSGRTRYVLEGTIQ